ncbi:hypothetical protein LRC484719_01880 [Mycobacterium riyadhense]
MWPNSFHSSGNVRLADADIVAPSSNHSDGLLAHAALMAVASTAIATGSNRLPRGRGGACSSAKRAGRSPMVGTDMMLVTVGFPG